MYGTMKNIFLNPLERCQIDFNELSHFIQILDETEWIPNYIYSRFQLIGRHTCIITIIIILIFMYFLCCSYLVFNTPIGNMAVARPSSRFHIMISP